MLPVRRLLLVSLTSAALVVFAAGPAFAAEIRLTDDGFEPDSITVDVGETIVWTNATDSEQTIVGQDGTWDSGPLAPDETFSVSLRSEGTVDYGTEDGEHLGQITVQEGGDPDAVDDDDEPVEEEEEEADEDVDPTLPRTGISALLTAFLGFGMILSGGTMVRLTDRR